MEFIDVHRGAKVANEAGLRANPPPRRSDPLWLLPK